jgi:SAM-dependent methyltransferase
MSYSTKLEQEIANYKEVKNVHDLPEIYHYWSNKYLSPKAESLGFSGPNEFYLQHISKVATRYPEVKCQVLSLGSGNCDMEVALAKLLLDKQIQNVAFSCLDINPYMLERGAQLIGQNQLSDYFTFLNTDINSWEVGRQYQVVIANHSLHHFVELEILFDKTYDSLDPEGFFVTSDIIGRNGHMRWPEALNLLIPLWAVLEDRHKWNHGLNRFEEEYENWDCSGEGFEGIRAQDILPLLVKKFKFDLFLGFANLISVFVDRNFGHNFDTGNAWDSAFIDFVATADDYYLETGRLKPTQMYAAMTKNGSSPLKMYKHLSPEFCLRDPQA